MLDNLVWARALVTELYSLGVRQYCVAPGSRSAPLALAVFDLARQSTDVKLHCHFDERGLGFFALNLTKVCLAPVVVITTSGTAVANLHPAVIEAWETQLPLLVFSADRPDKLQNCGANQAIAQKHLYGANVCCSENFTLPESQEQLEKQKQALKNCCGALGPSQVNCQFDEPLYAPPDATQSVVANKPPSVTPAAPQDLQQQLHASERTLIILGALSPEQAVQLEPWLATTKALLFCDINSQFRFGSPVGKLDCYDLCLMNEAFKKQFQPQLVIQFGGRLVSKRLNQWLADFTGDYWLLNNTPKNLDPTGRARRLTLGENSPAKVLGVARWSNSEGLQQAHQKLVETAHTALYQQWSEARICAEVAQNMGAASDLFIGNSTAIRMFDTWTPGVGHQPRIYSNRGASGIDGLIASSAAIAQGSEKQVVAVLGDTSVLHDLNSLALLKSAPVPVKVVVLNNNGGRIFGMLPAAQQEAYEALFAMPHHLNFEAAAAQFGLPYYAVGSSHELADAWPAFVACTKSAILECSILENSGITQIQTLMAKLKCLAI